MLQGDLMKAVDQKLVTAREIDSSLAAILRTQFRLGFYDDKATVPFSKLGAKDVHSPRNVALARLAAQQSMVLIKNDKRLLPLDKNKYGSIMVLGANAGAMDPLVGNYHGMSGNMVSFAEGITAAAGPGMAVQYDQGSDYADTARFGGIWAAGESDVAIAVIGLTPVLEGEEGDAFLAANGGDKLSLNLPAAHLNFLKELRKKNKPVIVVVTAGSAVDISAIEPYADAIILAWYPGEQGGNALADIVFGKVSPSGRLPITFYKSLDDLPAYENYNVAGRTYRYFKGDVQFPFGFGLSYTSFNYRWAKHPGSILSKQSELVFSVAVQNTGSYNGDEVIQAYIKYPGIDRMPVKELKGFKRVNIVKGSERIVQFTIPVNELYKWDLTENRWKLYPGEYQVLIGASSHDIRLTASIKVD
jgi:beta-glucosidase